MSSKGWFDAGLLLAKHKDNCYNLGNTISELWEGKIPTIKQYFGRWETRLRGSLVAAVLLALLAANMSRAAASLAQGYKTANPIAAGTIVSLDHGSTDTVVPANSSLLDGLTGVAIQDSTALLEVSSGASEVQVASGGVVATIVSDINGDIAAGDKLTASPISGVGMKATAATRIIGTAQADFKASTAGATEQKIKDKNGVEKTVHVGAIPVNVGISYYTGPVTKATIIPAVLQNIANALAGRQVSPLQIIVSLIIILIALIIITTLVYGSTKSSIISIGRNPLSQGAVYRSLLQVFALVIGILVAALASVYLILTRG